MTGRSSTKVCKDCLAEHQPRPGAMTLPESKRRPAPYPGPRCATHHRARKRELRLAAAGRRVQVTYSLTPEQYDALYAAQGGRCAICRRGKGTARKRLAVDHDHACCVGPTSCGKCVRGLVCGPCNDVLSHFRDDPTAFERGAEYLRQWPSQRAGLTLGRAGIGRV
jgi:hypothetical protein